jgi:hypothetical protein
MPRTKLPKPSPVRGAKILHLRESLIATARALMAELRPEWAGDKAVVTVAFDGPNGRAAVRFPSARE